MQDKSLKQIQTLLKELPEEANNDGITSLNEMIKKQVSSQGRWYVSAHTLIAIRDALSIAKSTKTKGDILTQIWDLKTPNAVLFKKALSDGVFHKIEGVELDAAITKLGQPVAGSGKKKKKKKKGAKKKRAKNR
jgi:hypothetical protein